MLSVMLGLVGITAACGGERNSREVYALGDAPSRQEWPSSRRCPPNLASICDERELTLSATINSPKPSLILAAWADSEVDILCRWPLSRANPCEVLPSNGLLVKGEAAIYSLLR